MNLLQRDRESGTHQRIAIPDAGLALRHDAAGGARLDLSGPDPGAVASIVPYREHGARRAALVVGAGARDLLVGGWPPLGVVALDERAELQLGGECLYFTQREPLRVTTFEAGAGAAPRCAVCDDPIEAGDRVIACGSCRAVSHEGERGSGGESLCFSHHGDRCAGCQLARADFEWTPPEED